MNEGHSMAKIFHTLVSVEEASKIIESNVQIIPIGEEYVNLFDAWGRILAEDMFSEIDSPPFDRSEVDGYAVLSADTFGAEEDKPRILNLVGSSEVGRLPEKEVNVGECMRIATGAPIPKGADAVVMVEYTKEVEGKVHIYRPVVPGENVSQAGSDYVIGDIFLKKGTLLTGREIASLAALGYYRVPVYKKPMVALFSSGNELILPGNPLEPGKIYDANGPAIFSMIKECGCEPKFMGILPDTFEKMYYALKGALENFDVIITSGSTSAGLGDLMYKVFDSLGSPGVIVHGLKIKPGKPTIIAVIDGKLVIGLPGFPVSASMIFTILVKPILMKIAGFDRIEFRKVDAIVPFKIATGRGRRTLIPVSLVESGDRLVAYPTPGSSGTVSVLNYSEGFIDVPENVEFIEENEKVEVKLFSEKISIPDLVFIGSHCPAIDLILSLFKRKCMAKIINLGSMGGLNAIKRREADICGTHLLDEEKMEYNLPFLERFSLKGKAILVKGYKRRQGIITLKGNPKNIYSIEDILRNDIQIVNRNKGSGTRTYFDHLLKQVAEKNNENFQALVKRIRGYTYEAKTHSAVALAILQGRADVGIGIEYYARKYGLNFIPLVDEEYDFIILKDRLEKLYVKEFVQVLNSDKFMTKLSETFQGYYTDSSTGKIIEP
ncbi:MAG: molybdopterin biosynthesis protein [Nitrososphaeria archaeon]|nr:molybdopterin biosynthesis protein [Nitrososphaeria archaeon]